MQYRLLVHLPRSGYQKVFYERVASHKKTVLMKEINRWVGKNHRKRIGYFSDGEIKDTNGNYKVAERKCRYFQDSMIFTKVDKDTVSH